MKSTLLLLIMWTWVYASNEIDEKQIGEIENKYTPSYVQYKTKLPDGRCIIATHYVSNGSSNNIYCELVLENNKGRIQLPAKFWDILRDKFYKQVAIKSKITIKSKL